MSKYQNNLNLYFLKAIISLKLVLQPNKKYAQNVIPHV